MIIAQESLRLPTIKDTLNCAVVLGFFGGRGASESQSVSGVITIYLMQCNNSTSQLVRLLIVACGMLVFSGCAKLPDIGRNWNTLIQSITNMLSGWYPVSLLAIQELGHFSFQELCAYPCNMGPCIMLQPELMVVDEWPQDLVKLFLCIQNAINKMHLCLLTYTGPCHNSARQHDGIHTEICPVQWKPGLIH